MVLVLPTAGSPNIASFKAHFLFFSSVISYQKFFRYLIDINQFRDLEYDLIFDQFQKCKLLLL